MNARTKQTTTAPATQEPEALDLEAADEDLEPDTGRDLAEVHATPPAALFTKGGTRALLERVALEARSIVADVGTAAGRATIRRNAAWVARSKATLEKVGLEYAREIKAAGVALDAERRTAREFLDALRDEVRAPLTALEEAERKRIEEINTRLAGIQAQGENLDGLNLAAIQTRLEDLMDMEITPFWGSATDLAIQHRATAINRLSARAGELTRLAEQEAELAKLRLEREAQAARERAQAEADRAARAQADAEAEHARAAQREAERRALAAEQQAAQERSIAEKRHAEATRLEEDAKQRIHVASALNPWTPPDRAMVATIHREIVADLEALGVATETARNVVRAIVHGHIPHLSITY